MGEVVANSEIANLEWRVIEAAIAKRKAELKEFPGGVHLSVSRYAFEPYIRAEEEACDALIAAREKAERGMRLPVYKGGLPEYEDSDAPKAPTFEEAEHLPKKP